MLKNENTQGFEIFVPVTDIIAKAATASHDLTCLLIAAAHHMPTIKQIQEGYNDLQQDPDSGLPFNEWPAFEHIAITSIKIEDYDGPRTKVDPTCHVIYYAHFTF